MEQPPKPKMTDWQKFALLIFAIVAAVVVFLVYQSIKGNLGAM